MLRPNWIARLAMPHCPAAWLTMPVDLPVKPDGQPDACFERGSVCILCLGAYSRGTGFIRIGYQTFCFYPGWLDLCGETSPAYSR